MMNLQILAPQSRDAQTDKLAELAAAAALEARRRHSPILASVTRRVRWLGPVGFFSRGAGLAQDRLYWEQPSAGWAMAAVGSAHTFTGSGASRFSAVDASWRDLLDGALIDGAPGAGQISAPVLLGGFAFDPLRQPSPAWAGFSEALLVLPRFLLRSTTGGSWLTINLVLWPDCDVVEEIARVEIERQALLAPAAPSLPYPQARWIAEDARPAAEWQSTVRSAAEGIRSGELDKVVLAREILLRSETPFDLGLALRRLRVGYPDCYVFAIARGQRCFLGASPERLVRAEHGQIQVTCLAGSIRRGATPGEDETLGRELLRSAKNRHEHALVASMLREALEEVCVAVEPPGEPGLLKLRNVQHLYTPLRCRLAGSTRLLEVVRRLHPTPAVGGTPREEALALIRACENLDRGWYAGPVGWLDASGRGEFAVALRSGLVSGATARLFAGCGIVADSDPVAEYEESRLKLRPMIAALTGS